MTTVEASRPAGGEGPDAGSGVVPGTEVEPARPDLVDRTAVHDLVVAFYRELVMDDLLAPVFEEVAEVDWAVHIPLLIDYWCRTLLGHDSYQGAILAAHRHVHELQALEAAHFDRWYGLWVAAIDDRWAGPGADRAKRHAAKIGGTLARRLLGIDWSPAAVGGGRRADGGGVPFDATMSAADHLPGPAVARDRSTVDGTA